MPFLPTVPMVRLGSLTSFFSSTYLVLFLPVCLIGFALMPQKWKKYYLTAVSYGFFALISGKLVVYLLLSTVSMYCFGILLEKMQETQKKEMKEAEKAERKAIKEKHAKKQSRVILLAVLLHIGVLLVLKYSGFFMTNINTLMELLHSDIRFNVPHFIQPIGISFFTFQALSYIFDVHRGTVKADHNFFRLALFLSFFPQIVEGPICRYNQTADQLWNMGQIRYENLVLGAERFLYGMVKKYVVADRLNLFVTNIFQKYDQYEGGVIAVAAVCYTIQLYMDFSGSMDAVCGTAEIFGITMPENFKRPFFSRTISEFWTRWHISLGSWFKDYIFYPVTTSKPMKKLTSSARKKIGNHYGPLVAGSIALFCVWLSNGLWHGAAWSFIFFGMYHFVLILTGNLMGPVVKDLQAKWHINPEHPVYQFLQRVRTVILVIIGELFFRAEGLRAGLNMFYKMVTQFTLKTWSDSMLWYLQTDMKDFWIVGFTLLFVLAVGIANEKGISLRAELAKKNIAVRWAVLYAIILFIIICGAYGAGYAPVDPMYAQF